MVERRPQRTRKPSAKLTGADLTSATKHIKKNYLKLREEGYVSPNEEMAVVEFEHAARAYGGDSPQETAWKASDSYERPDSRKKGGVQDYVDHSSFDSPDKEGDLEYEQEVPSNVTNVDSSNISDIMMQEEVPTLPVAKSQYAEMYIGKQVRRASSSALKKVGKTKAGYTKGSYAATYGDRGPNNKPKVGDGRNYDHYTDWGWSTEDIALLRHEITSQRREVSRRQLSNLPDAYEYDTEEDECDSEEALMDNEEEFDEDTTEMDLIEYAVEQAILQRTRANGEGERLQQKNSNGGSNSDGGGAGKEGGKDVGKPAQENINPEDLGGLLNAFSVTVATRNSIKLANKQVIYRRDQCTADEIGDSSDTMDREEQDDGMEGTKPPLPHVKTEDEASGTSTLGSTGSM